MAQRIENMKAVPIKNYDFQVDFKVQESDVLEKFLDPNENKLISAAKRPMSAQKSNWATTPKFKTKTFETAKSRGPNLTITGTANPDSECTKSDNPIAANIFHFKTHLPTKKLSENPKMALGMFKKKTIGTKSEKVLQGPESAFNNSAATGFFHNEDLRSKLLEKAENNPGIKHLMTGFSGGRKLTKQGTNALKEIKETNALKSSGTGHGYFQKRLMVSPKNEEEKEEETEPQDKKYKGQRPKSAIVSSAVSFMQGLKKGKKLKPPKKPDFMDEEENIENEDNNVPEEEEEINERRAKTQKRNTTGGNKLIKPQNGNEFDDTIFNKEEDNVGTETINPMRNRPQSAKTIKPIPKKKKILNEYQDEDYELYNVDKIQEGEDEDVEVEEYNQPPEQAEEIQEDNENNEEGLEEYNENFEEEPVKKEERVYPKRFRSNLANMLSELQQDVLMASNDTSFTSSKKESEAKLLSNKKEKDNNSEPRNKFEKAGHKVKKMLGVIKNGFTPYDYTSNIDGDVAQRQREQVTDEITDYLKKADEKRYKKIEMENKKRSGKYQSEPQEINEYTGRIESVNSRLKSSLQVMRNIVSDSKATTAQQNNILEIDDDD